jgi:hypothetical protein
MPWIVCDVLDPGFKRTRLLIDVSESTRSPEAVQMPISFTVPAAPVTSFVSVPVAPVRVLLVPSLKVLKVPGAGVVAPILEGLIAPRASVRMGVLPELKLPLIPFAVATLKEVTVPPEEAMQFAFPFAAIPDAIGVPPLHWEGVVANADAVAALPVVEFESVPKPARFPAVAWVGGWLEPLL